MHVPLTVMRRRVTSAISALVVMRTHAVTARKTVPCAQVPPHVVASAAVLPATMRTLRVPATTMLDSLSIALPGTLATATSPATPEPQAPATPAALTEAAAATIPAMLLPKRKKPASANASLIGGGIAIYVNVISGNLHKGVTQDVRNALVKTEYSKEPFYMLLLGTDESQERATDETYGGSFRSDSMMLARIDCPNKKVTLISLERDTLLDMGDAGWQKLNAASAIGGPAYAIEMVSKMAHNTPISHYALIDFDGFCDVVNALGGIDVDVPIEIDDDDAGGYLAAGPQTLNGDQALILCRSRHAYEEYGSGNSYRSANQRMVLSAIAQKILASDIGTIASTVGTLSKYLSTDLGINDIIGIAQALRGLDMSSDMYTAMQPTTSLYEDGMWYNMCDEPEWKEMLNRVNQGLPPTETDVVDATGTVLATTGSGQALGGSSANEFLNKKSGTVVIRNGGAPAGSGGKVGEVIAAMGYTTDIANANSSDFDETVIVYQAADKRSEAMEIAQAMGIGRVVKNDAGEYLMNGDFLVVLGSDYGA